MNKTGKGREKRERGKIKGDMIEWRLGKRKEKRREREENKRIKKERIEDNERTRE